MSKLTRVPGALLLGAGLMYFIDPARGRRRRARVKEALLHARRVERDLLGKASRDAQHRVIGLGERVTHRPLGLVSDAVISQRVRTRLGRAVTHPRAIEVQVQEGSVVLRGPVLEAEADLAIRAAVRSPGVREVIDRLERHATAGAVAALQGAGPSRARSDAWPPAARVAATGAGALLALYGLAVRRGVTGAAIGAGGVALALRGAINRPVRALFGVGDLARGVAVQKTITVRRPLPDVFELWSRLDSFPLFMEHVREVQVGSGGRITRWVVDGPAGTRVEFEAEILAIEPNRSIAWRTVPGQPFEHQGRVRFEEVDGGTRVSVHMSYRPRAGMVGHAVAHVLGWDPKSRLDDDLMRMKALLEDGRTRAHQQRVELADLH